MAPPELDVVRTPRTGIGLTHRLLVLGSSSLNMTGLTGLWQVSGRSGLSFDEMVLLDIYYIETWSLGLDVRILEGLADKNPSIEGMKLSRFDRVLGLNRERIESIYRGNGAVRLRACG